MLNYKVLSISKGLLHIIMSMIHVHDCVYTTITSGLLQRMVATQYHVMQEVWQKSTVKSVYHTQNQDGSREPCFYSDEIKEDWGIIDNETPQPMQVVIFR